MKSKNSLFLLLILLFGLLNSATSDPKISKYAFKESITSKHFLGSDGKIILVRLSKGGLYRSPDFGFSWSSVSIPGNEEIIQVKLHENDPSKVRVFAFSTGSLFYSGDAGENWRKLNIPLSGGKPNTLSLSMIDFHPTNIDWLIFMGSTDCPGVDCHSVAFYSLNNGDTWKQLTTHAEKCIFAQDVKFQAVKEKSVFCSRYSPQDGDQSRFRTDAQTSDGHVKQLILFNDFELESKILASYVLEYYVFEKFLGIAIEENGQVSFKASDESLNIKSAQFPPGAFEKISPTAFTILQSPSSRVFLDALLSHSYGKEMGSLMISDEKAEKFSYSLNDTNRNMEGYVDYERVQGIPGIIIANRVENAADVLKGSKKKVVSMISFNDGSTWESLYTCQNRDSSCRLHLHSRSELSPDGPIFSIKGATLLVGVGNVGDSLDDLSSGKTYSSRDGGRTWNEIANSEIYHEIIAYGSVVVASPVSSKTDKIYYLTEEAVQYTSLNSWKSINVPNGASLLVSQIIGQDDGKGKMVAVFAYSNEDGAPVVVSIDFSGVTSKCSDSDYESWTPSTTGSSCFLGKKSTFKRRKSGLNCLIDSAPSVFSETCDCSDSDLECNWGFYRDSNKECVTDSPIAKGEPSGCIANSQYDGAAPYRKIPGSECKSNPNFDLKLEKKRYRCAGGVIAPPTDSLGKQFTFPSPVDTILYLTNTTRLLAKLSNGEVYHTNDVGLSWEKVAIPKCIAMLQNSYHDNMIYFIVDEENAIYTYDGKLAVSSSLSKLSVPNSPSSFTEQILEFNAEDPNFIIYFGNQNKDDFFNAHAVAYYSKNGGVTWTQFRTHITNCQWGVDSKFKEVSKDRIYCSTYEDQTGGQYFKKGNSQRLEYSDHFYSSGTIKTIFDNSFKFAISENFIIAALYSPSSQSKLILKVTVDGDNWANAVFPPGVDFSSGYTVLETRSGAVTVAIHESADNGKYLANLYTSNSNGTFYSLSHKFLNRNYEGYVDHETMLGIDGISVINVISNPSSYFAGETKHLQTLITFNNGGSWEKIPKPSNSDCSGNDCSLNIHGFTERSITKNEMSDDGAIGIFIGAGNVGPYLDSYDKSNMFITIDGGVSWSQIAGLKGPHLFEFGDHGNLLVFAESSGKAIRSIFYSFDYGKTIGEMKLTNIDFPVKPIKFVTEPDSTSLKFVLIGTMEGENNQVSVPLDFSSQIRPCKNTTAEDSDFENVIFKEPSGDECVFGHVTEYTRRKQDRQCYIGDLFPNFPSSSILRSCKCKAEDFECSPGYFRDGDTCKAMSNYVAMWSECVDGYEYWDSPVRKVGLSTCTQAADTLGRYSSRKCGGMFTIPGRSFWGTFFLILIPFGLVSALGWLAYSKHRRGEPLQMPLWVSDSWERFREMLPARFQGGPRYEPVGTDDVEMLMDDYA